jgi:HlyD family secretion protein
MNPPLAHPADPAPTPPTPVGPPATAPPESVAPSPKAKAWWQKLVPWVGIVGVLAVIAGVAWMRLQPSGPGVGFISGNGRIEATEVDIATKLPGRVQEILVNEGDFVKAGQLLARMQIDVLEAQRDEAIAQSKQAVTAVASAEAQVAARESDTAAALAVVIQRSSDLDAAQRRFTRTKTLSSDGVAAVQELDDDRATVHGTQAAVAAAEAQVSASRAATQAAEAQVDGANSGVAASEATVARINADIADSQLTSPRDGRVQFLVAQAGEVLPGGGKVLNLVDLSDVYLTFFLPETAVGRVTLGGEVRIILDAASQYVIPAKATYVASVAQFTPKTVETASERQKLMFRVKAHIDPELLRKHSKVVKTGLPGVAWLKLDADATWPTQLEIRLPE